MPAPPVGRALTLLLEVQSEVLHQAAGGRDLAHVLAGRPRVDAPAPHVGDDLAQLLDVVGTDALQQDVPVRAARAARPLAVAGRELQEPRRLQLRPAALERA